MEGKKEKHIVNLPWFLSKEKEKILWQVSL